MIVLHFSITRTCVLLQALLADADTFKIALAAVEENLSHTDNLGKHLCHRCTTRAHRFFYAQINHIASEKEKKVKPSLCNKITLNFLSLTTGQTTIKPHLSESRGC